MLKSLTSAYSHPNVPVQHPGATVRPDTLTCIDAKTKTKSRRAESRSEGARSMDEIGRGFPPGDLRVSDADRDRALSELSEAFRVGRITADEFDQRSGQALRARTGKELTALLADLPPGGPPATRTTVPELHNHAIAVRAVMGASALAATLLFAKAVVDALSPGDQPADTLSPAGIAVLLVGLIIFLRVIRAHRA
jgi:hypothetical protein